MYTLEHGGTALVPRRQVAGQRLHRTDNRREFSVHEKRLQ